MATKVVVLGAGASRGLAVPEDARPECKPPLNADFFTQLQRITGGKHSERIENVMNDVVALFGSNFSLTLEDYFTQLEFFLKAIDIASRQPEFERSDYVSKRENLMAALSSALEASTADVIRHGGCSRHAALVSNLDAEDTIISFNYDCLIDYALAKDGRNIWRARPGYGFPPGTRVVGYENWQPKTKKRFARTIHLYKLHGSQNWQIPETEGSPIRLKQRLWEQNGVPKFTIIPPVWNKDAVNQAVFQGIWRRAARDLRLAHSIVLIGFSFAPTDLYAQSLFQIATAKNKNLKRLVIVNPDRAARRRTRQIFDWPLLEEGVLVRQYDDFADLIDALPGCLD